MRRPDYHSVEILSTMLYPSVQSVGDAVALLAKNTIFFLSMKIRMLYKGSPIWSKKDGRSVTAVDRVSLTLPHSHT